MSLVHYKNVPLSDVRRHVQNLEEFSSSTGSLFSVIYTKGAPNHKRYVVLSYGSHWPLFVYHYGTDRWFESSDKYSVTTSKHRNKAHPHCETTLLSREEMVILADRGLTALTEAKMGV